MRRCVLSCFFFSFCFFLFYCSFHSPFPLVDLKWVIWSAVPSSAFYIYLLSSTLLYLTFLLSFLSPNSTSSFSSYVFFSSLLLLFTSPFFSFFNFWCSSIFIQICFTFFFLSSFPLLLCSFPISFLPYVIFLIIPFLFFIPLISLFIHSALLPLQNLYLSLHPSTLHPPSFPSIYITNPLSIPPSHVSPTRISRLQMEK